MNLRSGIIATLLVIGLLLTNVTAAYAFPPLPSSYYGMVQVSGANVADGTEVSAWINGVRYAHSYTQTYNGASVYSLDVPGDDPATTTVIEGGVPGNTIVFRIASLNAVQTAEWQGGKNVQTDLSVVTANRPPVLAAIGNKSVNELFLLTFTAAAEDADQDALTFSLTGAPAGAAINASSGVFTWIPSEAQGPGTYSFTVRVSDGTLIDTEVIEVNVAEVNAAPVATADAYTTVQGVTLTVSAANGLLKNDTDADANALTAFLVSGPARGTLTLNSNGSFTYVPAGAAGQVIFTYHTWDGSAYSQTVTVTIAITASPDAYPNKIFLPSVFSDQLSSRE